MHRAFLLLFLHDWRVKFRGSSSASVLQVISSDAFLSETLLGLVLRIPARHWYKGITAAPALLLQRSDAGLRYGA
jgi:hypothetical protein